MSGNKFYYFYYYVVFPAAWIIKSAMPYRLDESFKTWHYIRLCIGEIFYINNLLPSIKLSKL